MLLLLLSLFDGCLLELRPVRIALHLPLTALVLLQLTLLIESGKQVLGFEGLPRLFLLELKLLLELEVLLLNLGYPLFLA